MKEQLSEIWNRLDTRQRRTMALVGGLTVVMLIVVLTRSFQTEWALLYGNLDSESANALVEELKSEKIPYKLTRQGTAIMVNKKQLYGLRLQLASQRLPMGGGVGFEIFDRTSLPGTEFANNINLQRALQGELSRSINCLSEVVASRVHLVMSKESLYGESTNAAASVVLTLEPARHLSQRQVQGLVYLIASSVPMLEPQDVTIIDSSGNILSSGTDAGETTGQLTSAQLEMTARFEGSLRQRLQSMLDAVIGQYKSIVSVGAELNFDTEQVQSEIYSEPTGDNSGLKSAHVTEESYTGTSGPQGAVAGITANLGDRFVSGGTDSGGKYSSREETKEYELSRQIIEKTTASGGIKRLTIGVIVDEELDASKVSQVKGIICAACGYDEQRGDQIVIERMPIAAKKVAEEARKEAEVTSEAQKHEQLISTIAHYGSGVAMVLVLGAVVLTIWRQVRGAVAQLPPKTVAQVPALTEGKATEQDIVEIAGSVPEEGEQVEVVATNKLVDAVRDLTHERPDTVAHQIEQLVADNEE